jgi:class 3 adenylate cyclase
MPVHADLPSGTVTFLFTDVEGSTKLLHALGADAYGDALAEHRRILREAFARHGGAEVDTQGDAFFVAFPTAAGALAAARDATAALADGPIRVRIGLHTGAPLLTDEGYIGPDVHKGARIAAAGHGGQVLASSATAALVPSDDLRDLGLHRLKDLTAPERIYQLGDGEHPPLKTLHQTNLPVPATPFLGRDAELADLAALLARDDVRLVTLTGPGGTGKTRLALQAAAEAAAAFPGGVWWVPLAALRDPALVLESAAKALGARGDLAEHIGDTRLVLLLDNFEHLTSAAADLATLVSGCPKPDRPGDEP